MTNSAQHQGWSFNLSSLPATAALAMAIVFALVTVLAQSAQAQTYKRRRRSVLQLRTCLQPETARVTPGQPV